jgi:hypothetical protein
MVLDLEVGVGVESTPQLYGSLEGKVVAIPACLDGLDDGLDAGLRVLLSLEALK